MSTPTVHLQRRNVDVKLGKPLATLRAHLDSVRMSDLMKLMPQSFKNALLQVSTPSALPTVASSGWGWGYTFGVDGWGMDGNGPAQPGSNLPRDSSAYKQGAGDCWWAMFAHRLRMWAALGGRPVPAISDLTLLTQYSAYIASTNNGQGYSIQTGENDNGTDPLGAYSFLEGEPFKDDAGNTYPVGPPISLTPGNLEEHIIATKICEGVGVGVQLQEANVNQFDQGQALAYVKGSPVEGGHELLQAGPNGMIEWGEHIPFVPSFIERSNDQSEATSSLEMFNAVTGDDANNASQVDVEKFVILLSQQKTNG